MSGFGSPATPNRFQRPSSPPTPATISPCCRVDIDADLPAVTIADPANIRIGDPVVAIGFALDLDGDPSVTLGIVSALDRTLTISDRRRASMD